MRVKEIPIEEYKKMWEEMKGQARFESPRIDPILKTMTVGGQSGPGTDFENEYERLMHEHFNPSMPSRIYMHDIDGVVEYVPKKEKENEKT